MKNDKINSRSVLLIALCILLIITLSATASAQSANIKKETQTPIVDIGQKAVFRINVTNNNPTPVNYTVVDSYNKTKLNFSFSQPMPTFVDLFAGTVTWNISTSPFGFMIIQANFTALAPGNTTNIADLLDNESNFIKSANITISVTTGSPPTNAVAKKTPSFQNVNKNSIATFTLNVTNNDNYNYTNYILQDSYNTGYLSYVNASINYTSINPGTGNVTWNFNLSAGQSYIIDVNFTATNEGSTQNQMIVKDNTSSQVAQDNANINIQPSGPPGPGPGNSNYTYLWNDAQPAVNFTETSLFNFLGAPYVARGPGCGFSDFNQYSNNSMSQPGKGCVSDQMSNPSAMGNIALDLGAVWANQNSEYIAWNIIGPFIIDYNLSVCGGTPNSNAGYVIEFDADDNRSTGCIGDQMSGEGCYPGSDYQIWYFPDTHESLFAYYNGTRSTADGRPANSGNCTLNPGEVCFVANTTVDVAINVTCNLNLGSMSNTGQNGLIIVLNKSALPANPKLNFETNSFNISTGAAGPIDMLSDNGANKFIFMGPGMDTGSCFRYDTMNQSACESNSDGLKCRWEQVDPTRGFCKPDFNNFNKGSACFTYNNSEECLGSTLGNCQWMNDTFAKQKSSNNLGLCVEQFRPMEFGGIGSCDTTCFDCYTRTQCNNSNANGGITYGGCQWYNDTFNPQGWCDVKGLKFGCAQTPFDCHSQSECEAYWVWNSTWNLCLKDANTEICFNGQDDNANGLADCQDPYCKDTAKFCGANIDTLTGDYKGMNPAEAQMMKLIGMNPNIINLRNDNITDSLSPSNESTELYGFSVVVSNLGLGMGIDMKNGSELKACDGLVENRKYMYMLDNDANISTGCSITLDSAVYNGYEYMVKYGNYIAINTTSNNTKRMYACYNNTWTMKDATVITPSAPPGGQGPGGPGQGSSQPLECGDPMAPQGMAISHAAIVVEKADVGNPKNDMRFMVFVVNGSWDNTSSLLSYDKIEDIYYTPGTIGFQPVDCFKEPTKCGTEFMMIGGGKFMPFEDCIRPDDEDLDGFINCQDQDCINAPQCTGQYNASNDKTAPKVKMSKIDTFEDAAFAMWSTNEPTNASLKLYGNDSSCELLNTTIWDEGMINNPADDFRPWHNIPINNMNLGHNLTSNTTYYYILQSTDMAGNPSKSSCLNFTTEADPKNLSVRFDFIPQGDPTDYMGNMTININGLPMALGNYTDKQNMDDVNITFENPTANSSNNWSIEFVGASLFQDVSFNFSDSFLANDTGEKGQLLGIENGEWLDAAQNLGIDYAILKIPSEGDTLYHCQDDGTDCANVTNYSGVEMLDSGIGFTKWKIPTTLGFSSYSVGSGENATNYTVTFANLTASYLTANIDTNRTITMNITNGDNVSRIYNFSIEKHANTLAWLNGSTQIDEYNMSAGEIWITNLTVNANAEGTYNFNIIARLSTNGTIVLNSSDDLTITLTATAPDTTPPIITIASPTNTTYSTSSRWFNATLNETGSWCAYSLDNAANTTMNGSSTNWYALNTSVADGHHTAVFYCNDSAGNMNATSRTFTVDTTKPLISINLPQNTSYSSASRTINTTVADANTDKCWYNYNSTNTTIANCVNATFTALDNQPSTLTIYANDTAGNVNSTAVVFTVDTTKPQIRINLPANTTYNSVSRTINITATDTNTDKCWYNYNSTNTTITNCVNATFTALDNQPSILTIYANDTAGNINSTSVVFTVDTLGPVITITSPLSAFYATRIIWFNVTLGETGSWCAYSLDNNANITMNGSSVNWYAKNASMSDDGHMATFYCNDTFGNMNTTSIDFPFFIDTTPASFISYARSPSTNEDQNVQVNVTLSENPFQLILEWNGTANYTVTEYSGYEYYFTILSGNYTAHDTVTYRWYAYDLLGNTNVSATQTFTVANQAPTMTTVTVNNTSPQTNDIILCNASAADNDAEDSSFTYQYKWYDTGMEITGQTSQVLALSTGTLDKGDIINCSARATDTFNYSSWLNSTNSATIINTVPTTPVLSAPANNTNTSDSTPTFTWTASTDSDNDTITYGIQIANDTAFANIKDSNYTLPANTYTPATTLSEGKYYWRVNATTSDANTSSATYRTLTVDTIAPAFAAPSPLNTTNARINTDITLSASDATTGLASISYSVNGASNVTSATTPVTIPLTSLTENITTTIDAYAQDFAGNVNHVSYIYTKDTSAPIITIISPTEETVETANTTTLNYTVSELPQTIWYEVDTTVQQLPNNTLANSTAIEFTDIAGKHTIYVYANDSVGNLRTETTLVKLNKPFNMSNYVDGLETLMTGLTANVTGNASADMTNSTSAWLNQTLNMTLNTTIALVTFENFNGLDADWQETFNINTTNTTVEDMIKGHGTNMTKMIHIKQLERFLENGKYNGTVTFGPYNSSNYTDIIYCSDDNGQLCARISSCVNSSFNGTACYVDALTSIKVHVPHFSTVVLGTDTIAPVISIDEPASTETNGFNMSVNATVTEDATACNYTINTSSISDIAMAALSTTQYSAITTAFLPNGDYNTTIDCVDAHNNQNTTSKLFTVNDNIKPIISSISSSVTSSTATITWTTSEKADAKVNRGTTTALGTYTNNTENTTSHSVSLSSLSASTTYYYNVTSCDQTGNCNTTGPNTFTTSASSSSSSSGGSSPGGSSSGGGAAAPPKKENKTKETKPAEDKKPQDTVSTASNRPKLIPGVGLRDNEKLKAAIEKVLAKGKMGDIAKENMIRLSASIAGDIDTERAFESAAATSKVTTKMKYNGKYKAKNFVVYEKIPKAFAASSDSITVTTSGKVEVVEKDPEYAILFPELNPGQSIEISYTINAKADPSVIDAMSSEVYAESIETPATKKPSAPSTPATGDSGPSALMIIALIVLIVIAVALMSKNARKNDSKESP